jgi:D-glycero-D-manno-heptose 1,7-bisphosphate phosphatase
MRRAVFLDKDGTLIEDVPYNIDPGRIALMPNAAEGVSLLHNAGYAVFVVTNQSGVGRRYFGEEQLRAVEQTVRDLLDAHGIQIAGFYYCPHLPPEELGLGRSPCACRKPEPGLMFRAAADNGIDLARSWLLGDISTDIQAGQRAGCRTVLVTRDAQEVAKTDPPADAVAEDLLEAAGLILAAEDTPRVSAGGVLVR